MARAGEGPPVVATRDDGPAPTPTGPGTATFPTPTGAATRTSSRSTSPGTGPDPPRGAPPAGRDNGRMNWISGVAGGLILVLVLASILRTLVVPRGFTPLW